MVRKPVVGVMGASENDALTASEKARRKDLAQRLGEALAARKCILVTGEPAVLRSVFPRLMTEKNIWNVMGCRMRARM